MSNLDELIERLCPDGVEYKTLGETSSIIRGASPRPIKNFITSDEKGINWIKIGDVKPGEKYITSIKEKITLEGAEKSRFVNIGDFILSNSMSFGRPYILKVDGCIHDGWLAISQYEDFYDRDFLYYLLCSSNVQVEFKKKASFGGAVQNLNSDIVKSVTLPVPPLEVQREIVRILDNFTFLTTELAAELAARQKQYEYYKEYLFENHISDVEWKRLDELFPFIRNGFVGTIKSFFTNEIDGIRYLEGTNIHDGVISDNEILYVTKEFHEKHIKNQLKADDILMVQSGHIGECAVVGKKYEGANCHALIIMSNGGECLSKYYVYYFHTLKGFKSLTPAITGGTIKHVLAGKVGKIKVPVPPLEVQKRIVDILDRFDTLCNDISSGLPAEIEARQKQYEYYRDKLLTFKELKKEA